MLQILHKKQNQTPYFNENAVSFMNSAVLADLLWVVLRKIILCKLQFSLSFYIAKILFCIKTAS